MIPRNYEHELVGKTVEVDTKIGKTPIKQLVVKCSFEYEGIEYLEVDVPSRIYSTQYRVTDCRVIG